jgi:hypothetical protein
MLFPIDIWPIELEHRRWDVFFRGLFILLWRHFTHLYKLNRSRAVYFTQEEQIVLMSSHEELKNQITARGNTINNNAREAFWLLW